MSLTPDQAATVARQGLERAMASFEADAANEAASTRFSAQARVFGALQMAEFLELTLTEFAKAEQAQQPEFARAACLTSRMRYLASEMTSGSAAEREAKERPALTAMGALENALNGLLFVSLRSE